VQRRSSFVRESIKSASISRPLKLRASGGSIRNGEIGRVAFATANENRSGDVGAEQRREHISSSDHDKIYVGAPIDNTYEARRAE